MDSSPTLVTKRSGLSRTGQVLVLVVIAAAVIAGIELGPRVYHLAFPVAAPETTTPQATENVFKPSPAQLAGLTLKLVEPASFRDQRTADGKIAIDDDRNTAVYPPYSGRVTQVFVKAGDQVDRGAPLFRMDSTDLVQAQNDYITAAAALNTAKAQTTLLTTNAKRQQALFAIEGAALKDVQQSQADLAGAQNNQHSAEIALAAVHDRLRILGLSEAAVRQLDATRRTDPSLTIPSPIAGIVTLRKLGLGQYLSSGATDPVITVGDLKTVWLIANAREGDAGKIHVGDKVDVRVTAYPERVFKAAVDYVAPSVDPNTHRLPIRAEVQNDDGLLKPEMFASFTIAVSAEHRGLAVPEDAVIYDGETARVWVLRPDGALVARPIKIGLTNGAMVEAVAGVAEGDKVVTSGSIFIDRAAHEG